MKEMVLSQFWWKEWLQEQQNAEEDIDEKRGEG
jgi:hypothetical protein